MMKTKSVIRRLVLLVVIGAFAACASTPSHESTGQYVDDSVITTKVKSDLAANEFVKLFEIRVTTYRGAVQLSGVVDSRAASEKARQIALNVGGVASVQNDLVVK